MRMQVFQEPNGGLNHHLPSPGRNPRIDRFVTTLRESLAGWYISDVAVRKLDHNCGFEWRSRFDRQSELNENFTRQTDDREVLADFESLYLQRKFPSFHSNSRRYRLGPAQSFQ